MRVSLTWIRRLLGVDSLPVSPEALQELLTLRTAEVESDLHRTGPGLDGVVVGKVLTCAQHPNADRLRCTTVDVGAGDPLPIVCGAPNVAAGQTVAVATVGTRLSLREADGSTKDLTIKAGKLRGEPSHGMICAEDELGLGDSHEGILVLDDGLKAGTPLAEALGLGDVVMEIDNHGITHRPDLWGHWGWAREVALICDLPNPADPDLAFTDDAGSWSARIDDAEGCPLYCGAVVEGVANRPSPEWMRAALDAAGVRPLGLLVDVTNYVMLEYGEPMHAFDRRSLKGTAIAVRSAHDGEIFAALDGKAHQLKTGDLVIDDGGTPVALAGIMGGEGSMVRDDTTAIVLEAAIFRPDRIRRTRIRLGMSTDSSSRFEKGLPNEVAVAAITRAIALLRAECPDLKVVQRFHAGALQGETRIVAYEPALYRRYFGVDLDAGEQARRLLALGFQAAPGGWQAPWWRRKDIHQAVDLVEEIARVTGFDHIVGEVPRLPAQATPYGAQRQAEHDLRRALSAIGWDEVATYPFASDAWAQHLGWEAIRLANPLSAEWTVLRRNPLPGLLEAVARNRKHLDAIRCYEIGKAYGVGIGHGDTPDERILVTGCALSAGDQTPVYAARDAALAALHGLGRSAEAVPATTVPAGWQGGRTLELRVGKTVVGHAGELHAATRAKADLGDDRVGIFQLDLEVLATGLGPAQPVRFVPPSRFQAVSREFTWICPEPLPFADLAKATRSGAKGLCKDVSLITIYRGAPYAEGEKAVSLRVVLQSDERTLEEKDLAKVQEGIARAVTHATAARQRT